MLKIGVLGVGHLGKIHLKCLSLLPNTYEVVGFFDPDDQNAKEAIDQYGIQRFDQVEQLLEAVDVIDIVTPTPTHYELAKKALLAGCHIFIEKPVTQRLEEAQKLLQLSKEKNCLVQVGHVERFNPALLSLKEMEIRPMFVEAHRLSSFNPRGTDVSVVLDLMIHDVDILLNLVKSPVVEVSASGVAVVSETPDICNARLEFENGCIANLTASRISLKQMRKMRLFQRDAYISLDFLDKNAQVVRLFNPDEVSGSMRDEMMELPTSTGTKLLHVNMPAIEPINAIQMELDTFAQAINGNASVMVSLEDGYRALEVAYRIQEDIDRRTALFMNQE